MKDQGPRPPQLLCEFCNGTGEISSFKGVSRFLLSREECPFCAGTGLDSPKRNQRSPQKDKTT